jgi:hypothetical protein
MACLEAALSRMGSLEAALSDMREFVVHLGVSPHVIIRNK